MTISNSALGRYNLAVAADPGGDDDLEINLLVTTRWLPRIGDVLNFDGARGETLVATVTRVMYDYRTDYPDLTEPEVDVQAEIFDNLVSREVAEELLDPVRLVEWAQAFPFIEAQPARHLVVHASVEVGMAEDCWKAVTDWNDWAIEVRARRSGARELT